MGNPEVNLIIETWKTSVKNNESQIWKNIYEIGGDRGWYFGTFLWRIRGLIDIAFGGRGFRKGRPKGKIQKGEKIDFWKVIHVDNSIKTLKLQAEMKLPGKVWITFEVCGGYFTQTVSFMPNGKTGQIYWFLVKPLHYIVFSGMFRGIKNYKR